MTRRLSLENVDFSDDFDEPDMVNSKVRRAWATYGNQQLVGNGPVTSLQCGDYRGRFGCLNVDAHRLALQLQGVKDCDDMVYHHPVFYNCHKPSCPRCFMGWASREARSIEGRCLEAEKRFGKTEHIIVSVPPERYGLSAEACRVLAVKALRSRGVVGGALVFHGFRENKARDDWRWSPHFHVLGFIQGGYGCRKCTKVCFKGCEGFHARQWRGFERDGWIVKVMGERVSVFQTARYQLSHASIRTDVKRPHAVFWFGVMSYRKMKLGVFPKRKDRCPLCRDITVKLLYSGGKSFCVDKSSRDFVYHQFDCLYEDGRIVFDAVESGFCGSGSSEERQYG